MKVRMLTEQSGPRPDGEAWAPAGAVMDVSDEEADSLIRSRQAAPLAKKAPRNTGRHRKQEHDQADAEAQANQAEANTAHMNAAQLRFAADDAVAAAEQAVAAAEDAEAHAEDLQARADKADKAAPGDQKKTLSHSG